MTGAIVRFSRKQRAEHLIVMILFMVLAVTGFPQKFYEARWAGVVVNAIGGLDRVRWLHRIAGILFSVATVFHVMAVTLLALMRRVGFTMVPTRQDFRDAVQQIRWYLGLAREPARFDRYDYRQKFEYWGLVFGAVIMSASGFILYFPIAVSRLLPSELIPAAKVMHSNEALLALLIVLVWHMAGAHLNPEVFPMDTSIFTGKISKERLRHEHPLEFEERFGKR